MNKPSSSVPRLTWSRLWQEARRLLELTGGSILAALAYAIFQAPHNIAAGGVSGLSIIINFFTGWPLGVMILVMNIPILVLGYLNLGGWRFVVRTLVSVLIFSAFTDLFIALLPQPVTPDLLLNAVYAGILGGIGGGFVFRSGGTLGGTAILGRLVQQRTGLPLNQSYLYTDGLIIVLAGIVFGWSLALYALLTLFLDGLASDYILEGPSTIRNVTIITDHPQEISRGLMEGLDRGVSEWKITGAYRGEQHSMLMCVVFRSQVNDLRQIVAAIDQQAFVVIGNAHEALGYGFKPLRS